MTAARAAVRPGERGDAAGIAEVHVASWRVAYAGLVPGQILERLSVERRTAYWEAVLAAPGEARVWVAERDGEIVGFAATGPGRDDDVPPGTGELESIYVHPDEWRRAAGSALFVEAIGDLARRGFDPLVLWVLSDNVRGRAFYERHGWRPDGAVRPIDFDGTPVDEIRYRPAG